MPEAVVEIVLVDDDHSLLRALSRQIDLMGYKAVPFPDAREGIRHISSGHGDCLVLDLRMPEVSGLDVQDRLAGLPVPIIFLSGHATIPATVQAMQKGAVTFLEKPVEYDELETALDTALEQGKQLRNAHRNRTIANAAYGSLTERQRDVFRLLITGAPNKVIAYQLGIGERTIKAHRHAIMERLGANSIADIYRIAAELDLDVSR